MQPTTSIEVGQQAPDFKLKGPGGQYVTLSEYRNHKNVVLVFYPLAFSPVCSHQLPAIERDLDRFRALDAEVLGISVDSHYANEAFARHLRVSFPLLSDFRREAMTAYGVLLPENLYSARAIFVVDRQGRIAYQEVAPSTGMEQVPKNENVLHALEGLR